MVAKEGASLLPTLSCFVKNVKACEGRFHIKKALFWLHMTTFTFIFCGGSTSALDAPGQVQVLVRKEAGNPADYFDKTFAEYQEGFSANGVLKQQLIQSLFIF